MYNGISGGYQSSIAPGPSYSGGSCISDTLGSYRSAPTETINLDRPYPSGGSYGGGYSEDPLRKQTEAIKQFNMVSAPAVTAYTSTTYGTGLYLTNKTPTQNEIHSTFLSPNRLLTQFIGTTKEVEKYIHKAFEKITGEKFPESIKVTICSEEELAKHHKGQWNSNILGFSRNKQGHGINEVFIKENQLDVLMLTIGHEIGHVMSPTLNNAHDEEAKAFAFELAWIDCIIYNNIAGLSNAFNPGAAKNGLHDVALNYVEYLIRNGKTALQVFTDLVSGRTSIKNKLELIVR